MSKPSEGPLGSWMKGFHDFWIRIRRLFAVLAIVRFSLLIPTVLTVTVFAADQMVSILLAVGEDHRTGATLWLLAGSAFAGLVVWYTARTMLRFRFASNPASDPKVHPILKRILPRLLGIGVPAVMTLRVTLLAYGSQRASSLWVFAGELALMTSAVAVYVFQRRNIAAHTGLLILASSEESERRDLSRWRELPTMTRRVFYVLIIANFAVLGLFMWPLFYRVGGPATLGAPAILLLGLGLMCVTGSLLVYMANHYAVPILTLLALWTAICSPTNDNHMVRITAGSKSHGAFIRAKTPPACCLTPSPLGRNTVRQYFNEWWMDLVRDEPPGTEKIPVFIIAADGGGIRAAYWTAMVLAALEDATVMNRVPFSRHVFAISGVSGGSFGAAAFDAMLASRASGVKVTGSRLDELDRMLGEDFLSPTLGAGLFPDLVQRFLPVPVFDDRAMAMEESWERAWAIHHPTDLCRFCAPFHDLWGHSPHEVPLLFLNSTVVETGQRAIVMPLDTITSNSDSTFSDALSVGRLVGTDLPLSTAAHLSARFTYVSPAGLIDTHRPDDTRWLRLVDGGYFDNSGAVTAQEIVRALTPPPESNASQKPSGLREMRLIVLHLPNEEDKPSAKLNEEQRSSNGHVWFSEILAPVRTLLHARGARGTQAVAYLQSEKPAVELLTIRPCRLHDNAPLGWVLSPEVRNELKRQLQSCDGLGECAFNRLNWVKNQIAHNGISPSTPEFETANACLPIEKTKPTSNPPEACPPCEQETVAQTDSRGCRGAQCKR